jgi:uracil-DNA glycosylase
VNIHLPTTQIGSENDEDLFAKTRGPRDAEVIFIGEAFGSEEQAAGVPFVGHSGKELDRILHDAGFGPGTKILFTNCINRQPPGNDFTHFLFPSKEKNVPLWNGAKLKDELLQGIQRLYRLINRVNPKLIVCAGNWPLFVVTEHAELKTTAGFKLPTGVAKWRGSQTYSRAIHGRAYPTLPIIHPAAILREWGWRTITVHDLRTRAKRFLDGTTAWEEQPKHKRTHKPSWTDVQLFTQRLYHKLSNGPVWLSVDLETFKRKWISVVGLADEREDLVIPLFLRGPDDKLQNYWPLWQEQTFFRDLKALLEHPNAKLIGQNFIYDTEWLARYYNIRAICSFDTMVAHHLLFPGTPKRLEVLASLYNDHYIYWKDEREDWDQLPEDAERYWLYNAKDIRATYESAMVLQANITKQGLQPLLDERMEQWTLSREMSLRGTAFDSRLQSEMKLTLLEEASSLQNWLLNAIPDTWQLTASGKPWFDSPTATANILYTILGLQPVLHKKTKRPTTDDAALAELSERPECKWLEPVLSRLRHLRSIGVFTRNFLSARTSADGRMRGTFNIAHPETFRWSSNSNGFGEGMNLQNIPKGDKDYGADEEDVESTDSVDELESSAP